MKNIKNADYYKNYIYSNKELDEFSKIRDSKIDEFFQLTTINSNMPTSKEMLNRVQEILSRYDNEERKTRQKKVFKIALIASVLTIFLTFSTGVTSNMLRIYQHISTIKNNQFSFTSDSKNNINQDYSEIFIASSKLNFTPLVPNYLPSGIRYTKYDKMNGISDLSIYFEDGDKKIILRQTQTSNDKKREAVVFDINNSKENNIKIANANVTLYSIERENNNSYSFRWFIGDINYAVITYNISYKEIIKTIKNLQYLE